MNIEFPAIKYSSAAGREVVLVLFEIGLTKYWFGFQFFKVEVGSYGYMAKSWSLIGLDFLTMPTRLLVRLGFRPYFVIKPKPKVDPNELPF